MTARQATRPKPMKGEANFEDILAEEYSKVPKSMPENRPLMTYCFMEKDEEFTEEVEMLQGAVVVCTKNVDFEVTIDEVARYATQTKLVHKNEVSIGALSNSRFLILLPTGLSPEIFIEAIPKNLWHIGFAFSIWSPLDEASINVPQYKVLIDLLGIPPHLYREKAVIRAASSFGTYLGSVDQNNSGNIATWTMVVATDDLARIPQQVTYVVGGVEKVVTLRPRTWKQGPIYKADDMPKQPRKFKAPPEQRIDDGELFTVSRRVLQDLCSGKDLDALPPSIRAVVAEVREEQQHGHKDTSDPVATEEPDNIIESHSNPCQDTNLVEFTRFEILDPVNDTNFNNDGEAGHVTTLADPQDVTSASPNKRNNQRLLDCQSPGIHSSFGKGSVGICNSASRDLVKGKGIAIDDVASSARSTPNPLHKATPNSTTGGRKNSSPIVCSVTKPGAMPFLITEANPPRILQRGDSTLKEVLPHLETGHVSYGASASSHVEQRVYNRRAKRQAQAQKEIQPTRFSERLKRKKQSSGTEASVLQIGDSSKKPTRKKNVSLNRSEILNNPEGFVEVRVDYEHCLNLADGCGFKLIDVENVIRKDNEERREGTAQQFECDQGEHINLNFDPDSEDDLGSDLD